MSNKNVSQRAEDQMELFKRFVESSGQGLGMAGLDGRLQYANATLCRLLGEATPEDVYRGTVFDYYDADTNKRLEDEILPVVKREGQWIGELIQVSRQGRATPTIQNIFLIRDDRGEPLCLANVVTDISERRRMEAEVCSYRDHLGELVLQRTVALEESNARLQEQVTQSKLSEDERLRLTDILESTSDLVATATPEGRLTYMNAAGRRMLGWSATEDLHGHTVSEAHPNWAAKIVQDEGIPAACTKGTWQGETAVCNREGLEIPVSQVIITHRSTDGQLAYVSTIMRDISERKHAEQSLRESEEKFRTVFEYAPVPMAISDRESRYVDVNAQLCERSGLAREEILGRRLGDTPHLFDLEDPEKGAKLAAELWQKGWLHNEEQRLIRRSDGARSVCLLSSRVINVATKPYALSMLLDITERRRLEDQLRQSQKMEAIGQLAGGVAHDFNNLLTVILGFVDLVLTDTEPTEPHHDCLLEIRRAGERASALPQQLLAFSRRQVLRLAPLDVNEVVAELVRMLDRLIGADIELIVVRGRAVSLVNADRAQLEQVLMNLCVNARDAMPNGGHLSIETEAVTLDEAYVASHAWAKPGAYVLLSVTDSGCGMDQATQGQIFEPFFTTKEKHKGTGLGLAMVYGIVRQHQGMVQVYSELGKGTRFKIYLPAMVEVGSETVQPSQAPVRGGRETILLAEDDEQIQKLAQLILGDAGYRVLVARDGEDAMRQYQAHADEISLLLLDVVMPKQGGRAVYDAIRALNPAIKCLFASGYSSNAIHTNYILESGLRLLQKPFGVSELLRAVRQILDEH